MAKWERDHPRPSPVFAIEMEWKALDSIRLLLLRTSELRVQAQSLFPKAQESQDGGTWLVIWHILSHTSFNAFGNDIYHLFNT